MTPRAYVGIVGAALIAVGILLFLIPVSVTVHGVSGTCDSSAVFNGLPTELLFNNSAFREWQSDCADSTSTRTGWGWGLVGVGLLTALGSAAIQRPTPNRSEAAPQS